MMILSSLISILRRTVVPQKFIVHWLTKPLQLYIGVIDLKHAFFVLFDNLALSVAGPIACFSELIRNSKRPGSLKLSLFPFYLPMTLL